MVENPIQTLLDDIRLLGEEQIKIVESVRSLVKATTPGASEQIKYGGILFALRVPFCGVFAYRQHVSVEFGSGAKIKDVYGHLEGKGKGRRHLKLRSVADIESKKVAVYLRLALAAANEPG